MFRSRHSGRPTRPVTPRRRLGAVLAACTLALGGLVVATAPAAQADLSSRSTTLNAQGFPTSYTDSSGLSLDLCLDTARCLGTTAEMIPPDGEAFYYAAFADVGGVSLELALEAAFADLDPIVFQRTQYQADAGVLVPGAVYTMTDPYGVQTCTATANRTRCRIETGGGPRVFSDALSGRIGPFLRSTSAPAGFIGDNVTATTVTGSPTGFNRFRVQGPGLADQCGTDCIETTLFTLQGRIAGNAPPGPPPPAPTGDVSVTPASLAFGDQPVDGGATASRTVTVTNTGTAPLTGIAPSSSSADFPITDSCPATLQAAASCTVGVRFDPTASGARTGTLTVANDVADRTVSLTGRGTAGALSTPNALAFGNVNLGSTVNRTVLVTNNGTAALTFGTATLAGAQAGDFGTAAPATTRCTNGLVLDAGDTCQVGVSFKPSAAGSRTATLQVTAGGSSRNVALSGTGVGAQPAPPGPPAPPGNDNTNPDVASHRPADGARKVSRNANVDVRFTETVQGVTGTTFTLTNLRTGDRVAARVTRHGSTWRLDPNRKLAARTTYRVDIVGGGSAIRDLAGNALASESFTFTTRAKGGKG